MLEEAVRKYGLYVLLGLLLAQLLFSEGGIVSYITLKRDIKSVNATITALEQDNQRLTKEIGRLQTDDQYLEDVARKKYGFVREGERVYRVEK